MRRSDRGKQDGKPDSPGLYSVETEQRKLSGAVKMLIVWAGVAVLTIGLAVYHFAFYTDDVQHKNVCGYGFEARAQEDGSVRYTVTEVPSESSGISAGEELLVKSGDELEYGGESYYYYIVYDENDNILWNVMGCDGYVLFPDGDEFEFTIDDTPENASVSWRGTVDYENLEEAGGYDMAILESFTSEPSEDYPADMIASAVMAHKSVGYNLEHPRVWHHNLALISLLLLAVSTAAVLCDDLMSGTVVWRGKRYFDLEGTEPAADWAIIIRKFAGVIGALFGIFFLVSSFFIRI